MPAKATSKTNSKARLKQKPKVQSHQILHPPKAEQPQLFMNDVLDLLVDDNPLLLNGALDEIIEPDESLLAQQEEEKRHRRYSPCIAACRLFHFALRLT